MDASGGSPVTFNEKLEYMPTAKAAILPTISPSGTTFPKK